MKDFPSSASSVLAPDSLLVTPVREDTPSVAGSVQSALSGGAGLAVHLRAEVPAQAVTALAGQRVWVTAHTGGRLLAFQAVAQPASATSLDLGGVTMPVEEHRRAHIRAATRLPVHLRVEGGGEQVDAFTVDLSRGSCRVQLPDRDAAASLPRVGTRVALVIDLAAEPVAVESEVLRVDRDAGQTVLRFTSLAGADAERIERHVLRLVG